MGRKINVKEKAKSLEKLLKESFNNVETVTVQPDQPEPEAPEKVVYANASTNNIAPDFVEDSQKNNNTSYEILEELKHKSSERKYVQVSDEDINKLFEKSNTTPGNFQNRINKVVNDDNLTSINNEKARATCNKELIKDLLINSKKLVNKFNNNNDVKPNYIGVSKKLNDIIDKVINEKNSATELFNNDHVKNGTGELFLSIPKENLDTLFEIKPSNNNVDNNYEHVNHPNHYNNYDIEVIDMMERIWGPEKTAVFCELNAFKYRMRMGTKPDNNIEQDIKKEKWYLNKMKELKNKFN